MSAEVLREAARLMRERAEGATPGLAEWWVNGDAAKWAEGASGSRAFAAHIASWHPAVALAVADWLDEAANLDGQMPHRSPTFSPNAWVISWTCLACGGAVNDSALDDCSVDWRPRNPRAIAVALAYLGEQS